MSELEKTMRENIISLYHIAGININDILKIYTNPILIKDETIENKDIFLMSYHKNNEIQFIEIGSFEYKMSINKPIEVFKELRNPVLAYVPDEVCEINIDDYTTSYSSQVSLINLLLEYSRDDIYSYIDDEINYWIVEDHSDYQLVHGYNFLEHKDDCEYIDGRIYGNDSIVEQWWDIDYECLQEYLKEIDPKGNISIVHRKGKDWYVGYSLEEERVHIGNSDGYGYETYYSYNKDEKTLNKITQLLKNEVLSLKINSEIYNALHIGNYYTDSYNYAIDFEGYDKLEEPYETAQEIMELANYNKDESPTEIAKEAIDIWRKKCLNH